MRPLAVALCAALAALLLVSAAATVYATLDRPVTRADLAYDEAQARRIEREADRADDLAPLDTALAAAWRLVPLVAVLAGLVYLGGLGAAHVAHRGRYAAPDSRGLLPVERADQHTAVAALAGYHGARLAEAQRPQVPVVPHSLHYAPHYAGRSDPAAVLPGAEAAPALAPVPSFAALLDAGRLGPGRPMLLGVDRATGELVNGSWLDLYSCAVGGLSGTGKSWTATFLLTQAALQGSRLLILDPHAESAESLAARLAPLRSRFMCDPADTAAAMLAAVKLATGELARRKAGGYVRGSAPMVIVADEFAALQRGELAEPLAELVEALGQEGRKLDLYGMVCSQVWSSERAGGTPLRDSLASAYVHRLRPAQARMMTGLTSADIPGDLFTLPAGSCYLVSTGGELRGVTIPQMCPADVARVAELLGGGAPSPAPTADCPLGFHVPAHVGAGEGAAVGEARRGDVPHPGAVRLTAEEAAIVAAFLGGKSPSDLAAELAGGKKAGDAYGKAARRIADILRKALGEVSRG